MSGQLEWSALTARGNSRTWRKNCTANGPRAVRGSRPSAIRSQSGWRPKARPASIIARRSSTKAPPPGIGPTCTPRRESVSTPSPARPSERYAARSSGSSSASRAELLEDGRRLDAELVGARLGEDLHRDLLGMLARDLAEQRLERAVVHGVQLLHHGREQRRVRFEGGDRGAQRLGAHV